MRNEILIRTGLAALIATGGAAFLVQRGANSSSTDTAQELTKNSTPVTKAGEFGKVPDGIRIINSGDVVTATATITATVAPAKQDTTPASVKGALVPAERSGNGWVLQHPDGDKTEVRQMPDGFTPDRSLTFATDIKSLEIGSDLKIFSDWETALNTKRPGGALAGYNYDYNDFCPTGDFKCNVQGDMFGWRTFQGDFVEVPGIGRLEGGPRRSVVLNVLNLDGSVHAWDNEKNGQVTVKRGFTATGRIFNGEKNVDALERNLSGHWAFRQFFGTPEKSYIGITDNPDNALEVLMVSVQRKQWGNNPDGTKRMEFQLIRAEILKAK